MARVAADDVNHAATADNFALIANSFNAGFDFHRCTQTPAAKRLESAKRRPGRKWR
jgi:hypothetical protein